MKLPLGYGIEFDGWQNIASDFQQFVGAQPNASGDPSSSHIAYVQDYVGNHLVSVNDPRAADSNWHTASVEVQGSSVTVAIDQVVVLQWSRTLNRTFDGFGFSGANGQVGSHWHIIEDFSITAKDLHSPSLTTSLVTSVSQSSYHVKINGALTFNGAGVANAPSFYNTALPAENPGRTAPSYMQVQLAATPLHGSYPLQEITC